jgi:hypothetical protein
LKSTTASTRADDGGEDAEDGEGKRRAEDVAMAESERLGRGGGGGDHEERRGQGCSGLGFPFFPPSPRLLSCSSCLVAEEKAGP